MTRRGTMRRRPASKAVPESSEVRAHREDEEALELANVNRYSRTSDTRNAMVDTAQVLAALTLFATVTVAPAFMSDLWAVIL